jgi:ribosome-binding factor A
MTHRPKRVGELIRRELSMIIEKDYTFGGMFVTIHQVEVAPDLKNATVHVGVIGGKEEEHSKVLERLNKLASKLQQPLYKRVTLKSSPRLYFKLDRSAERGVRIVRAIEELPQAIETDAPMGDFEGSDGLDHRWEKQDESER